MEQNMMLAEEGATATDTEVPAARQCCPRRLALAALPASALLAVVTSIMWPGWPVPLVKRPSTPKEGLRVTLEGCQDTDDGATNRAGEGCAFWNMWAADGFPHRCHNGGHTEYYDDTDYTAFDMCCACGGGSNPVPTPPPPPAPPPPPTPFPPRVCEDTDNGAKNRVGESCAFWNMWAADGFPHRCHNGGHTEYYDDTDYTAFDMCCACGGGSNPVPTPPPPPAPPPPPSKCQHAPEGMVHLGGKDTLKDTDDAGWIENIDEGKCRTLDQSDSTDGPTIKVCGKVMVEAFTTADCSASEEQVVMGECVPMVDCNVEMNDKKWLSYKLKRCHKCLDTDNGATNRAGEGCAFWNMWAADGFPHRCHNGGNTEYYDDTDYTAFDMCCACGGGSNPTTTTS